MRGKGADRRHAETLHALAPPECLNVTQQGVGGVEGETQHREKAFIGFREDVLGQPVVAQLHIAMLAGRSSLNGEWDSA